MFTFIEQLGRLQTTSQPTILTGVSREVYDAVCTGKVVRRDVYRTVHAAQSSIDRSLAQLVQRGYLSVSHQFDTVANRAIARFEVRHADR